MGDSLGTSYVLNNLGFLYKDLQQYDSAADYYQRALLLKQKVAGERSQAITIANLGELALLQENYSEALPRLLEARQIFQEEKDTYNLIWVGNILTSLYLRQNETALARPLLDSIRFYLSQDLDAREERLNYLNNEYLWHETNEQPAQALVYHKKWAALRDSLFNKEKLQVQQIQSAYQLRQEEQAKKLVQQEAALARAEVRRQTAITIAVSFILGIIIGLGLLLYRQYAKIKRLSRKNELLVKEQHHRVKNNLQVLSSMLRMQARRIKLQSAKEAIKESELRVHAMSLIHHRLYGDSSTRISMKSYLEELIREVIDSFGCNPHLDLQLEDISLDDRQAAPIGLIVNEVLSNACKYAFPDHPSPELKVRLTAEGKRGYQLSLHDNGPGLDHDAIKKNRTFGMELIMLQAEQIYAKAKFTNQQGNLFTLSFSKSYQDE
jgi:two-component sensor histidine kinase